MQVAILGAGGVALTALVIQLVRAARADREIGPVSHEWLSDWRRERSDRLL